jgi:hypothetical protein
MLILWQFLSFFKMAIKLFGTMFLITCVILVPINKHFDHLPTIGDGADPNIPPDFYSQRYLGGDQWSFGAIYKDFGDRLPDNSYSWAYLVFTYVFSGLIVYFMRHETLKVIRVRQEYLGTQSTVTDRTIRLSGIPEELRSEEKIKQFLEKLELGKVESISICRNWEKLDDLMEKRGYVLRRLEEAWAVHLGRQKSVVEHPAQSQDNNMEDDDEAPGNHESDNLLGDNHVTNYDKPRPSTRLWYGFLGLQSRRVDAIDHYEEQLRKLDDKIKEARNKEYEATPFAFVTMDSIPACQMAVQAVLDPSPGQLLAKLAPAPSDIVWRNTYLSRSDRMIRSWVITVFILFLTVFWFIPVVTLGGLVDICSIRQVWPALANFLESHEILQALVQTGLPTLIISLLNIAVPFLYDYLANQQGMISQGDVELSVISKNFFFTFFNLFLIFTVSGTASKFWPLLQDSLKDTTKIAYNLATSVKGLAIFYTNFILLQSFGLLPFRLLQFGSVSLYPFSLMGSKTPRDYAELIQPPVFKYGFYLPSAILIFILCMVYSILPAGYMVLFFGVSYFVFGYYIYKYQLLYAMEHPRHSTGRAWPMICYRIMVGLGVFQVVMAALIALQKSFTAAILVLPLIPITISYSYYYARTYEPLTKFIALGSITRGSNADTNTGQGNFGRDRPLGRFRRWSITIDESREKGAKFMNPNLVAP